MLPFFLRKLPLFVAGLSLIGLLDSFFIVLKTNQAKSTGTISCAVTDGCGNVLFSSYSKFLGIPLGVWGVIYYFLLTLLAFFLFFHLKKSLENKEKEPFLSFFTKLFLLWAGGGFLFSSYLFYVQKFVLNSLCFYCLISFVDISLIFFLTFFFFLREKIFFFKDNS